MLLLSLFTFLCALSFCAGMEPAPRKDTGHASLASQFSRFSPEESLPAGIQDALLKLNQMKMRIPIHDPSAALAGHYIDVLKRHMKENVRLLLSLEEVQKEMKAMESWGQFFSNASKMAFETLVNLAHMASAQLSALISGIPLPEGEEALDEGQLIKLTETLFAMKMQVFNENQKLEEQIQAAERELANANVEYRCRKIVRDVDEHVLNRLLREVSLEVAALSVELDQLYAIVPPTNSWSSMAFNAAGGICSMLPIWNTTSEQSFCNSSVSNFERKKLQFIKTAMMAHDLKAKVAAAKEAMRLQHEAANKRWLW